MKALLAGLMMLTGVFRAVGQGTVNFANTPATWTDGIDRYVYADLPGGLRLTGTNYVAALYFGTSAEDINQLAVRSEADQSLLSAVGHFRNIDSTSSLAGTWSGGVRYLLGTTVGQILKLQVRVWDITRFATFDEAVAARPELAFIAQSCPFDYTVPSVVDTAGLIMNNFRGLPDYRCVPEPSALATITLGIVALLTLRVRRHDRLLRGR